MTIPAASLLLATDQAMRMQIARDKISMGQGKLTDRKAAEFAAAMEAAYEALQRALADQLKSETP